jgi:hypothetical protein
MGTRICKRHYLRWLVLSLLLYQVPVIRWAADQADELPRENENVGEQLAWAGSTVKAGFFFRF